MLFGGCEIFFCLMAIASMQVKYVFKVALFSIEWNRCGPLFMRQNKMSDNPVHSENTHTHTDTHSHTHNTESVMPEPSQEGKLCWRQSVSPTHNNHLSLLKINEDDRWGLLSTLTEALRRESRHGHSDGAWLWPRRQKPWCWFYASPEADLTLSLDNQKKLFLSSLSVAYV